MRLHGLELFGREVTRSVEFGDLSIEGRKRVTKLFWGCLSADRDRAGMIERVIIDNDSLPQPAVDESLLKLRARIVEHVREHVGRVCRLGIFSDARSLPLHLNGDCAHG